MRNTTLLLSLLLTSACELGMQPDPPLLKVTSPQRSLIQDRAGDIVVTGTVAPNPTGEAVASVTINDTRATINADGTFSATIQVPVGATLIHTVATDAAGGLATDTRSVVAGERRAPGSNIQNAVGAAISANAFGRIGEAATTLIKSANLMALIAPLNPVVHAGDEAGPDCLYAQAFVDSVTISDAKITLTPVNGGLQVSATLDQPRITGRTRHAVACIDGASTFDIRATSATIGGVLQLSTNGMNGFTTQLVNPVIQLPGLQIIAPGIPQAVLNILPLEKVIQFIAPTAVRLFVNPMLNDALGALTGPQKVAVLGKTINLQVAPSAIAFDPSGGNVMLDMKMLIEGTETSPGFTFTPNGMPTLVAGDGLALGIADDLANDALAQLTSTGLLNVALRQPGSSFNSAQIMMTAPPMISADGTDGRLRLILPDMMVTFLDQGTPVARAAVNVQIALAIKPADGGSSVAIELGTPAIAIDELDDLGPPMTPDTEFATVIELGTNDQKGSIADVLKSIPLPKLGGITLSDVSVTGANGYVLVKTTLK
jgi:hypothetical protein